MTTPIPRPGQHLPGHGPEVAPPFADPARVHAEVEALLSELGADAADAAIPHRARVLEQAHDVLVRALATVDKI